MGAKSQPISPPFGHKARLPPSKKYLLMRHFVYMVETYINGNFETFRRLYHELNKDARRDFMDFLLSEVEPTYWREILKQII